MGGSLKMQKMVLQLCQDPQASTQLQQQHIMRSPEVEYATLLRTGVQRILFQLVFFQMPSNLRKPLALMTF